MIITIDGPSGTGKSTVAKAVADKIGFTYFDTGAMYRAFTYYILQKEYDLENESQLQEALDGFQYEIRPKAMQKRYYVNNEEVTSQIRDPKVTANVSTVAAVAEVRKKLVDIQKQYGQRVNAVFEGRDLGTVVFPGAEIKIFLTAVPEVRARRRYDELIVKFPELKETLSLEELSDQIRARDEKDSTRKVSPLRQADDAHLIDTSEMSIEEVLETILAYKDRKAKK